MMKKSVSDKVLQKLEQRQSVSGRAVKTCFENRQGPQAVE